MSDGRGLGRKHLLDDDPKREPRAFALALSRGMGKKRGRSEGSFVAETRRQAMDFYRDLVQELQAPRPKAPRLKEPDEAQQPEPAGPAAARPATESRIRREQETGLDSVAELASFTPLED